MHSLAKHGLFVLLISTMWACEEVVDWELQQGANAQLVVEAILTDEFRTQEVRLSRSFDAIDGVAPGVSDALVSVSVNGNAIAFVADPQEVGLYRSERLFRVFDNLEYTLDIDWQGQRYSARCKLAEVAAMPAIFFQAAAGRDSLTFGDFVPVYNPNQQAMYELNVDWSHLTGEGKTQAITYLYTFNTIDVSGLVRPAKETILFPRGSIVTVRKYGLSDEFAHYLRALVIETQWKGGVFYSASSSLPTNLSGGAIGFFSACEVEEERVVAR